MKTKIETKIQEDMHGCIQFYCNSWIRMSVGLSICKMFIFMHFHPKPCFEVFNWGTQGLLVMNICPFTIKQDALFFNWPLCSSHYHWPQLSACKWWWFGWFGLFSYSQKGYQSLPVAYPSLFGIVYFVTPLTFQSLIGTNRQIGPGSVTCQQWSGGRKRIHIPWLMKTLIQQRKSCFNR